RRRLERDPGDHIAGTQLEAIYRQRGDWEGVIRVLLDRAEVLDNLEAARVLSDVADIYASQIGDVDAAMVVLQTAFAQSPDSARLADRLTEVASKTGRWDEVIDIFVVHAAKLSGRAEAVASELWLRVAWGHLAGHGDIEAAAAALEQVIDLQSSAALAIIDHIEEQATSPALLGLFADICRRLGDEDRLLRTLNRLLSALEGADGSFDAHYEIGRIQLERADVETAEWHLIEALRHDPAHTGASELLMELYKQRGEYLKAARLLEVGREVAQNPLDQVQLSFEAAQIYASALDEQTMAVNLYESALKIDPEHVGAALPLARRYFREERWYELEPIIDMLVRRASALGEDAPPLHEIIRMAGQTAARLGKADKARRHFDAALNLKPDDLDALQGLGAILVRSQAWDEAAATLKAVLDVYDRRGDYEACVGILLQLGECARHIGDLEIASQYYRQALRMEPSSSDAMEALSSIYLDAGDLERAVEMMRAELRYADDARRVRILAEIGRITSRELRDPARAITIFQQALEIDPSDREVLHQLVEHYSAAGWWEDAVEAIVAITELEENPLRRGKYLQAAAVILRNEVGNASHAADLYDEALDCFYGQGAELPEALRPSCIKAFADLGRMLSTAGQWKRLEQSYRKMIRRIDPDDPVAADLWHGLGEIYRSHLGHRDSAIGSFEV
ncbi:MAG: tetratricopeptide repeat protein, partial [Deltaproteobacteria bacterium]|nr:tetratricopeptide repeat protein [Deltaproteobacteria bacterium]